MKNSWTGKRKTIVFLVCSLYLAVVAASAFLWDRPLAVLASSMASPSVVAVAKSIGFLGNPAVYFLPSAFGFIYYVSESRQKSKRNRALLILFTSTNAAFWVDMMKFILGRSRPHLFLEHSIYAFQPFNSSWDYNSFPSEHAAVASAMAMSFAFLAPVYAPTFLLLGLIVSGSRILIGAHYLSDVLAGSFIGVLTALLTRVVFERRAIEVAPLGRQSR